MTLKPRKIYPYLVSIALTIFVSIYPAITASASKTSVENYNPYAIFTFLESIIPAIQTAPTITSVVNLPIIEQNAPTATPTPLNGYPVPELVTPIATFTPTATPIPIQTGSTNVPIVLGALVIIAVVVLAWFFVGYIPRRTKT